MSHQSRTKNIYNNKAGRVVPKAVFPCSTNFIARISVPMFCRGIIVILAWLGYFSNLNNSKIEEKL